MSGFILVPRFSNLLLLAAGAKAAGCSLNLHGGRNALNHARCIHVG